MATKKKTTTKKTPAKRTARAASKSTKVDYYPNRVPFLVAVVAVVLLLAIAYITSAASV